jgi:hypothetical protein
MRHPKACGRYPRGPGSCPRRRECAARRLVVAHLRAVVGIADHEFGRDHAILEDLAVVIDVLEEQIERGDALDDAGFDLRPLRRRQDTRDDVEGQDAINYVTFGVDGECDAEIE